MVFFPPSPTKEDFVKDPLVPGPVLSGPFTPQTGVKPPPLYPFDSESLPSWAGGGRNRETGVEGTGTRTTSGSGGPWVIPTHGSKGLSTDDSVEPL